MNWYGLFFLTIALFGAFACARQAEPISDDRLALSLQFVEAGVSRVDALGAGDAVGVFARIDGRETYAFENHQFVSNASGALSGDPAAYYPESKQATRLYAYYPYFATWSGDQGRWSTPTDQTSNEHYRGADLLWGEAVTTPTAAAVPIPLEHLLAQVAVAVAGQAVQGVTLHDVSTDGVLSIETGALTLTSSRANVTATGRTEVVVPAQSVAQLSVDISGVAYTFAPTAPIVLESGQRHTIHLALNQAAGAFVLSLDRVSVGPWVTEGGLGRVEHAVNNTITAHWLLPHPDFAAVTKTVLRVVDGTTGKKVALSSASYTLDPSSDHNVGQCSFTIALNEGLNYPFRIESIDFLRADGSVVQSCGTLVAQGIYRSGAVSFGIYQDNILLVTSDPITAWDSESVVGGIDNIKYKGNTFRLKVIEPDFAYQQVAKVRLSIWGGVAEWNIAAPTVSSGFANFVVETVPFTFPDAKGYAPTTRHYPIEWVELVDAGGGYLYRGYCNLEVSEQGDIALLLYQKGAVHSPSAVTRPIEEAVSGALGNVPFVGNQFRVRFVGADFIDSSRPKVHTIKMGVLGDVFSWSGVSLDDESNFFTAWVDLKFPDQHGSAPTSQHYKILWVEVLDASGGYLYKSYCNVDVTRSGVVTLDLHQRGVVSNPTTVGRPTEELGESNPLNSTKYVANAFDIRFFEPPFAYWTTNSVALTCSDNKTYTWNTGIGWNGNSRNFAQVTPSWPDRSGARPAGYPFKITKIEAFSGAVSIYSKAGLSVEVSSYGTVLFSLYK